MANILSLDQSSRISGWSVFSDNKLIKYGKFNAEIAGADIGKKLQYICTQIEKLIKDYQITEVVFEDIQMQTTVVNNVQTFKVLAQVQGAIIKLLEDLKIPYSIILASIWKSKLGIKGRARAEQKHNAQNWVINEYGVKPTQDECDSICIGNCYILEQDNNKCAWDK